METHNASEIKRVNFKVIGTLEEGTSSLKVQALRGRVRTSKKWHLEEGIWTLMTKARSALPGRESALSRVGHNAK